MGGLEFERLRDVNLIDGPSLSSFEAESTGRELLTVEDGSESSVLTPTRTPPPMTRQGTGKKFLRLLSSLRFGSFTGEGISCRKLSCILGRHQINSTSRDYFYSQSTRISFGTSSLCQEESARFR